MVSRPVESSSTVEEAARRFLESLRSWVYERMAAYDQAHAIDEHDQGTFMTGWEPYLRATQDAEAMAFVTQQRDRIRAHFVESGQWRHGYWKSQEAHHGTEHFELFLGMLARLNPDDPHTNAQILDASEHIGNWVGGIPDWFNWQNGLFHSVFLGTERVGGAPGAAVNVPDHLRCVNIALLAYRVSGQRRYLDMACAHGQRWTEAILQSMTLPIALLPDGERGCVPIYKLEGAYNAQYRSFMGELPEDFDQPLARAENFLASDSIGALLRLWRYSGQNDYRAAAECLLDVLATGLNDPDAGSAADAIRSYWRTTGSDRYNAAVLTAALPLQPYSIRSLSLEVGPKLKVKPLGVGKRTDMLTWLEDGAPRRCSPILLSLAAEIKNDARLATAALDLGRVYLELSRQALPDGRNHGCAARSVSAVARGHGRENHAGVTTAVLKPLLESFSPSLIGLKG